jgi:hypothetical protein
LDVRFHLAARNPKVSDNSGELIQIAGFVLMNTGNCIIANEKTDFSSRVTFHFPLAW